jgi:hypothetical protein
VAGTVKWGRGRGEMGKSVGKGGKIGEGEKEREVRGKGKQEKNVRLGCVFVSTYHSAFS